MALQALSSIRSVSLAVAISIPGLVAHESIELEPYTDIAGVRTVCAGETAHIEERKYTTSECLVLLAQRVEKDFKQPLRECLGEKVWDGLPIEMQSAFISLSYNIGVNAFCNKSSTARYAREGDWVTSCDKIKLWNKARVNGRLREVQGLTNRRLDERRLCLEGANSIGKA